MIDNYACGVFSDMGFGKTAAATTAAEELFRRKDISKLLIVTTLLVARETWPTELQDWEHTSYLTFNAILGNAKQRLALARGPEQIHIINQENFVWLVEKAGKAWPYPMIVFDDSSGFKNSNRKNKPDKAACVHSSTCCAFTHKKSWHCKLSDTCTSYRKAEYSEACILPCKDYAPKSRGSKACETLCDDLKSPPSTLSRFGALCAIRSQVKRLVHLTGTPSSKGLLDLWPLIFTLDNGVRLERTYSHYKNKYFNRGYNGFSWSLKEGSSDKIHKAISDICIYIESEAELPPVSHIDIPIVLPPKAAKMYDKFERDLLYDLEGGELVAANNGVLSGKLLQVCGGAVYYNEQKDWEEIHDEKLKALDTIIEKHAGEPILVGFNFHHELDRLKKRYPHGVDIRDRKDAVHAWNSGSIPLLFVHPRSAGHGLNLQKGPGRAIFWLGLNWALDLNRQLNKRLHRPGQERECFIYYAVAFGRVDELLMKAVAGYGDTQDNLLEALKNQAKNNLKTLDFTKGKMLQENKKLLKDVNDTLDTFF